MRRVLHDRGDQPLEDARLSRVAKWMLRRAMHGAPDDRTLVDAVSRRVGFPGPAPWIVIFHANDVDADVTRRMAALPVNVPISRFGIAAASRRHREVPNNSSPSRSGPSSSRLRPCRSA